MRRGAGKRNTAAAGNGCHAQRKCSPAHNVCGRTQAGMNPSWQKGAIHTFYRLFYSLRKASMGLSLEALMAGIRPNTTPITMEKATAMPQAPTLMATGVPITELSK